MTISDLDKKWIWPSLLPENVISELAYFSPIERFLLHRRDLNTRKEAEAFLRNAHPQKDDPFILKDMEKAVDRILAVKNSGEQVVIYGDYDADGITATALLIEALRDLGIQAKFYIPDRMTEGYGLNDEALNQLRADGADLIITVDCGIRAVNEIKNARSMGIDIIITDHHAPGAELPEALAIINPKQKDDPYPFRGFAGVGLAYKLAQAMHPAIGKELQGDLLELVAIGTVADLAPLLGENRYLVSEGLEHISHTKRRGLQALLDVARLNDRQINPDTIGFGIGPRINAAGRLENAARALELLITEEEDRARELAVELDSINRRRQMLTGEVVEQARSQVIEEAASKHLILAAHPDFHEGIVGLAASRLMEEFYKPAIVATVGEDFTRGSARSIPGFHITEAFDHCTDLLHQYGGHSSAAGFTVPTSDLQALWDRLEDIAADKLSELEVVPSVELEAEVTFSDLTSDLLSFVESLQPCGIGNPKPLLGARDVQVVSKRTVGRNKNHLKMMLKREGRIFDAIAFRKGDLETKIPRLINIAFYIERNVYMGYENIQLNTQEISWQK
jgi:single-stranded-DNA-specific exonuclease